MIICLSPTYNHCTMRSRTQIYLIHSDTDRWWHGKLNDRKATLVTAAGSIRVRLGGWFDDGQLPMYPDQHIFQKATRQVDDHRLVSVWFRQCQFVVCLEPCGSCTSCIFLRLFLTLLYQHNNQLKVEALLKDHVSWIRVAYQ